MADSEVLQLGAMLTHGHQQVRGILLVMELQLCQLRVAAKQLARRLPPSGYHGVVICTDVCQNSVKKLFYMQDSGQRLNLFLKEERRGRFVGRLWFYVMFYERFYHEISSKGLYQDCLSE